MCVLAQVINSECVPTFKDWVSVDAILAVARELTKEDIISMTKMHNGTQDDKQEENIMEEGPLPDPVTFCEAMTATDTLTQYLETIETDQSVIKKLLT